MEIGTCTMFADHCAENNNVTVNLLLTRFVFCNGACYTSGFQQMMYFVIEVFVFMYSFLEFLTPK